MLNDTIDAPPVDVVELVRSGFYDDTPVSRVVPGFVAQFGINWREPHRAYEHREFNDDPSFFALERGPRADCGYGAELRPSGYDVGDSIQRRVEHTHGMRPRVAAGVAHYAGERDVIGIAGRGREGNVHRRGSGPEPLEQPEEFERFA